MKTDQIIMCVVLLLLGMLLFNMLQNVCGCKNVVEGQVVPVVPTPTGNRACWDDYYTYDTCCGPTATASDQCWDGELYTHKNCCRETDTSACAHTAYGGTVLSTNLNELRSPCGQCMNDNWVTIGNIHRKLTQDELDYNQANWVATWEDCGGEPPNNANAGSTIQAASQDILSAVSAAATAAGG